MSGWEIFIFIVFVFLLISASYWWGFLVGRREGRYERSDSITVSGHPVTELDVLNLRNDVWRLRSELLNAEPLLLHDGHSDAAMTAREVLKKTSMGGDRYEHR
jgi:hypothetical protein